MFARGYAFITGFDTTLVLFMWHNFSSPFWFCCCFKRRIQNPAGSRDSGRARSQCSQGRNYKSERDDACFCDLEQIHTFGAACWGPVCKSKEAIGSSRTIDRTPLNRSEQSTGFRIIYVHCQFRVWKGSPHHTGARRVDVAMRPCGRRLDRWVDFQLGGVSSSLTLAYRTPGCNRPSVQSCGVLTASGGDLFGFAVSPLAIKLVGFGLQRGDGEQQEGSKLFHGLFSFQSRK